MNGIDKITARIETDAVADAARMAEETTTRCADIRAEGEKTAQERYWVRLQEGIKAAEERVSRLAKAADMEARKSILVCKQRLVEEAFDKVEEKLRSLPEEKYIDFLASQAARASVTGTEEIVLTDADAKAHGGRILSGANARLSQDGKTAKLTLSSEKGDFSGGLILRQGNISVNCTIEALMAQARADMAADMAAGLFS